LHILPANGDAHLILVQALAHEIWLEHYPGIISHRQVRYMLDQGYSIDRLSQDVTEGIRYHLLYIDDQPAGFSAYSTTFSKTVSNAVSNAVPNAVPKAVSTADRAAALHKLYLRSAFHGQGIGSMLLSHVESLCENQGCSTLALNVNKHNTRAIKAYRRNGFIISRSTFNHIGLGFYMDDFYMTKALPRRLAT
jgi:diamine N-acetyltransferase